MHEAFVCAALSKYGHTCVIFFSFLLGCTLKVQKKKTKKRENSKRKTGKHIHIPLGSCAVALIAKILTRYISLFMGKLRKSFAYGRKSISI